MESGNGDRRSYEGVCVLPHLNPLPLGGLIISAVFRILKLDRLTDQSVETAKSGNDFAWIKNARAEELLFARCQSLLLLINRIQDKINKLLTREGCQKESNTPDILAAYQTRLQTLNKNYHAIRDSFLHLDADDEMELDAEQKRLKKW